MVMSEVMRDIKFRAWDYERKQYNFTGKSVLDLAVWYGRTEGRDNPFYGTEELEQFTGLKDKKGKEVYEGDFLRLKGGSIWRVEWCNLAWQINKMPWDEENEPADRYEMYEMGVCEIIGNIHQNPKLIEEAK